MSKPGKDPVCGMDITEESSCIDYNGKHYCFCSEECRKKFEEDPDKYISGEECEGGS